MFGIGPVPAVKQALERANWSIGEVERFEINEAFAAIAVAVTRDLGLPEDIVNVEGNSIAHGHPIGATGAIQTTRLLHSITTSPYQARHRHDVHRRRTRDRFVPGSTLIKAPHLCLRSSMAHQHERHGEQAEECEPVDIDCKNWCHSIA